MTVKAAKAQRVQKHWLSSVEEGSSSSDCAFDYLGAIPLLSFVRPRFWREADVRGAILESAAEGKTIAAKRGSRGALELWPTIEQGTNRPPSTLPLFTTV